MCCEGALKPRQEAYKWTEEKRTLRRGRKAVKLSWARNNLSELQTINLTLRFNSISIVTSAFGRSRSRRRRRSWHLCPRRSRSGSGSLSMSLRASTAASFCTFGNALSGGTQD